MSLVGAFEKSVQVLQWLAFQNFCSEHKAHSVCTSFCDRGKSVSWEPSGRRFEFRFNQQLFVLLQNRTRLKGLSIFFSFVRLRKSFVSKGPPSNFWYFAKKMDFQKTQRPPFTFFGVVRFFKMTIFCLKIRFSQWPSTLYPNFWRYIWSKFRFIKEVSRFENIARFPNFWLIPEVNCVLLRRKRVFEIIALYSNFNVISEVNTFY